MPQPPRRVELEPPPVLLGVDDQDAAGADGQVDAPMAVKRWWLGQALSGRGDGCCAGRRGRVGAGRLGGGR
jgi:hypothetical protein